MSTDTASDHQLQIQPRVGVNAAGPNDPTFVKLLEMALGGGEATYDFFAGHFQALQQLYETVATGGDEVWLDGVDNNTGMPIKYVAQGNNFLTVAHEFTDLETLKNGTGDKTTYKPVGISYITFTSDQGTSQTILNDIHYAGLGLGPLLAAPLLAKFAVPLLKAIGNFIKNLAIKIYDLAKGVLTSSAETAASTVESNASAAAEESGEVGAEVAEGIFADVSITVAQGALFIVGIGILAVVFILQILEKKISAQMRFYNLTAQDVTFGICLVDTHTAMTGGPADVGKTALVPKVSKAVAPPWVTGSDTGLYYAEANFLNSNELYGVGFVLSAEKSGSVPAFKVAVEIPSDSRNYMEAAFTDESCQDLWAKMNAIGSNPEYGTTTQATAGSYTLRVATNATSGQSPSPLSGEKGYNYEYLVVLTDGSVPT